MNDPDEDGQCLLVMMNSIKASRPYDSTCLLQVGDHDFVRHDSYINYRIAEYSSAAHIVKMVEKHGYKPKADFSKEVFKRICEGLYSSDETKPAIRRYAKKVGI